MSPRVQVPILVVDDDDAIRDSLRAVLEDEGYQVIDAADGLIALEVLRALPSRVVVLTNHTMPRLDGPGLVNIIVEDPLLAGRSAVIYMTAGNRIIAPTFAQQLRALHAPVLRKPFDLDALFEAIEAGTERVLGAEGQGDAGALPAEGDSGRTSMLEGPLP